MNISLQPEGPKEHLDGALSLFHPAVREWFTASFSAPTAPQLQGWPVIARGDSTLILAPTGTGKTLTAFLWCIHRLMFEPAPQKTDRCRVIYISPLKALAVDVERNLRSPLAGISHYAKQQEIAFHPPVVGVRTGDTPSKERARFRRAPSDILITTPESLYLLLTSNAREALRSVDTVIIDEIHVLVPTKRGSHLMLSIERLEALCGRRLQRIGLSATQRPLEEVSRFLGGAEPQSTTATLSALPLISTTHAPSPITSSSGPEQSAVEEIHQEFAVNQDQGEAADQGETEAENEAENEAEAEAEKENQFRPVTIVDTGVRKKLDLHIEVPVEDMARLGQQEGIAGIPGPKRTSIWSAIHPKLIELIKPQRSTLIFVNNRRTAERLAAALNDLAGEPLVRAHHGSIAMTQRREIEDLLKAGQIKALVATSSLELGIDMGAIDLVIQIESPPSVASGMQRIGRASHQVGATSTGVIFPKHRADLVACAALTLAMHRGQVESTRYPRNPLDVLAQQIVAMVGLDEWRVDELFQRLRQAAPFVNLSRPVFEGLLNMLAGRYPSDEFAELRPRITWDRTKHTLVAREGARSIAVINGGTIPDRGMYGVFLSGANKGSARVGELDEEMVFESRVGDTFLLGASTWRIEEISHNRVVVAPAPGEPGKMPFWHGDLAGRPLEFGQKIGAMVRELQTLPRAAAVAKLTREHDLDLSAAENLMRYLADQAAVTEVVPSDKAVVIERVRDELGDWRVCVLTPLGSRVHAPWAMAATLKIRAELGIEVETMWSDDGFVVRFPETDEPPDPALVMPNLQDVERQVIRQLGMTSMFAAKFREIAARALLLPKYRAGARAPLWHQRKRAADLLAVASRFGSFPMLLETYRECLRDVFDIPALVTVLRGVANGQIRVHTADTKSPSPFASALLFSYVANYIYEGDAPLAERRAQALTIDQAQLRELMGDADLRELLDQESLDALEAQLQAVDPKFRARSADGLHDLLLRLGDLSSSELETRSLTPEAANSVVDLEKMGRVRKINIAAEPRWIAVEDAARYRDALGISLPQGLPDSLLQRVEDAGMELIRRYARTHGPFTVEEVMRRFGFVRSQVEGVLKRLAAAGRVIEGEFRPTGVHREWCDQEVLRTVRRRSLAKLRHEVEPVEQRTLGRLITIWQGVIKPRTGLDALLDAVESLQGAPLPASILEEEILSARVADYQPSDLDALMAAGEIAWVGVEPLGERDGRLALFLTDHLPRLWQPKALPERRKELPEQSLPHASKPVESEPVASELAASELAEEDDSALSERQHKILEFLRNQGASFFSGIHSAAGGGYSGETTEALWNLIWRGYITNDTYQAVRAFTERPTTKTQRRLLAEKMPGSKAYQTRRSASPIAQGRWSLISARIPAPASLTEWSAAVAGQLLNRYGVLTREAIAAENLPGGFSALYDVLKAMEETGRLRRGYFVAGLGATQFALPAGLELLRSLREGDRHGDEELESVTLAATDPANPYGAILHWPNTDELERLDLDSSSPPARVFSRSVGARVILVNGMLTAYFRRGADAISVFLPEGEPLRSIAAKATAVHLRSAALEGEGKRGGLLIAHINGIGASQHPLASYLQEGGFVPSPSGFHVRRRPANSQESAGVTFRSGSKTNVPRG